VGDLAYFEQPRYDFAAAAIFPLALFATYYWARLRAAGLEAGRRRRLFGILLASVIGLLALTVAATPTIRLGPTPETHAAGVRHFHEMLTLFWVPVIALHCLWNKRLGSFLLFYLAAFVYGMLQESGGVTLGYFSEEGYSWYLPFSHAPAVTMFGWSTVFYPAVAHLEMFERGIQRLRGLGVLGSALLVTVIACFLDAMLDPMASAIGLWVWNPLFTESNTPHWLGVPVLNFAAWFWAVLAFGLAYFALELRCGDWSARRRVVWLTLGAPLVQLASGFGFFPTMMLLEGVDGPSLQLLRRYLEQLAGG
jgi:hypothetical protein